MFLYNESQTVEKGFTVGHLAVSFVGMAAELDRVEGIDHDLVLQALASNSMYSIFKEGLRSVCREMGQSESARLDNIEKWDALVWSDSNNRGSDQQKDGEAV